MKYTIVMVAVLAIPYSAWGASVISTCGETIQGNAKLTANLDCSGFAGTAVTITRGRLNLNGFTLTGNPNHIVIGCEKHCGVKGPGTITGGGDGIIGVTGVNALGTIRVSDLTITGISGVAVSGTVVLVKRSTISGNGSTTDPGVYAFSGGVHASHRVKLRQTVVENNLNWGVHTSTVIVTGSSSVVGNGTNADCLASLYATSMGCADLAATGAAQAPAVSGSSVCGTSQKLYGPIGLTWGVCSND